MSGRPVTEDQRRRDPAAGAPSRSTVLRELLRGPAQLLATLFGLALLVALGLLVAVAWRGIQRLEPLGKHFEQQVQLRSIDRAIKELLDNGGVAITPARLSDIHKQLVQVIDAGEFSDPAALSRLRSLAGTFANEHLSAADLDSAHKQIQDVLDMERTARQRALSTFKSDAKVELVLAVGALLVFPTTAFLVLLVLRERITRPLRDLNDLLALIGEGRSRPAPTARVEGQLRPIMESYNRQVEQLSAALTENQQYQARLESMVQDAAGALIRQQHELAEADRLSAVGEITARVAHELKNPLAGIQMALVNLREDCKEGDQRERLDLVSSEVGRVARLLDQLLVRPNLLSEPCQKVEIRPLVADLLSLLRYQISERITLENEINPTVRHWLPPDRLRQVLLNLLLNSVQAIGEARGAIVVKAANGNSTLRLSVMDDGPGFPSEILEQGIRPFVTTRMGGTGLGLSTVQRLTRTMKGRLELANREPRGAVATLVIGCKQEP